MRTHGRSSFTPDAPHEGVLDGRLLGRLGSELAHLYGDTLQAPLPAALHSLMERLEAVLDVSGHGSAEPAQARDRGTR